MQKVKIGIIGIGKISHRFIKGLKCVEDAQLYGVSSRSIERTLAYAQEYSIEHIYASYEEMLEDVNIDAVYIATPNHLHFEHIMLCLKYKKHVICEKPFTVHVEEAKTAFAYAKEQQCLLMEAMKACFLPVTMQVKKWIEEGKIGTVRYMEAGYCSYTSASNDHPIYKQELGGGSFYDIGIYPLAYVNYLNDNKVIDTKSMYNKECHNVDDVAVMLLHYANDVVGCVKSAISYDGRNDCMIYGTEGTIQIDNFWKSEKAVLTTKNEQITFEEKHNQSEFQYQIRHFVGLIQARKLESPIMSAQATILNVQLLEGLRGK